MLKVTTKDAIAAINAAGWTAAQVAHAIRASEDDVANLLKGARANLDADAMERFDRWVSRCIGYNSTGLCFDRPPAPVQTQKIVSPPVVIPDDYILQSAANPKLTNLGIDKESMRRFMGE
jgi:hypothetical protein